MITKRDINHWLCSPFDKGKRWIWRFDNGSKALGSDWQKPIPVTGLLLAAIAREKVKIRIEYDHNLLVGGFNLHLERINGDITPEDFDGLIITRKQAERIHYGNF